MMMKVYLLIWAVGAAIILSMGDEDVYSNDTDDEDDYYDDTDDENDEDDSFSGSGESNVSLFIPENLWTLFQLWRDEDNLLNLSSSVFPNWCNHRVQISPQSSVQDATDNSLMGAVAENGVEEDHTTKDSSSSTSNLNPLCLLVYILLALFKPAGPSSVSTCSSLPFILSKCFTASQQPDATKASQLKERYFQGTLMCSQLGVSYRAPGVFSREKITLVGTTP
ncbi:uncharacterized protein LOC125884250 [Epinephelus fuscoguttatus]|uniref:uncharacterized protein LOC125884250 n=1 Tax=Epinephelus fuscoguttatus TaxID=293821 RepID=UPI0020D06E32|nr:uncharacterized protein LOC125884250 [Epinephelus fuscoguttatus]